MMAFDSTPPPRGELDPATTEAMRAAIASAVAVSAPRLPGGTSPTEGDAALHAMLRRVAHEARERSIPPERLLVLLKTMWRAALTEQRERSGEVATDRQRVEQDRRLGEVVTLCIAEYYREE